MRELIASTRAFADRLAAESDPAGWPATLRRLADALERSVAENARLRSEDGPYERALEAVDTFAHEHFAAVGRPVPRWVNSGEGALCLKEELARLRAENERLRRERDRLFAWMVAREYLEERAITGKFVPFANAIKEMALVLQLLPVAPCDETAAALAAHDREQENHGA